MRFSKFFKWHLYNYEDCLWSKFQFNLTFFTGFIALNPRKWAHRVMNQKNLFLLGKVKNRKYSEAETWHPESIDRRSYYRLCENFWWPFGTAPQGQFRLNGNFFLLNFTRIWFFWDLRLTLFDIPANAVFAEILFFSKIFGFLAVNGVPKWTKTVTFQWVPFEPNFKVLKDFSNNVFVLFDNL